MKMRYTEFEGTPEEFLRISHRFPGVPSGDTTAAQPPHGGPGDAQPSGAAGEVTAHAVEHLLTRRPLSVNMKKVLRVLMGAGSAGLTTREIAEEVGISPAELSGVFGAFGRRMAHTPGWDNADFVDVDDSGAAERYSLKPIVREVLESGRIRL
jgi:hypothetical protein